jgi:hypothetical protein
LYWKRSLRKFLTVKIVADQMAAPATTQLSPFPSGPLQMVSENELILLLNAYIDLLLNWATYLGKHFSTSGINPRVGSYPAW